ncbi:MAG TPA: MBL fold metallo-hydrolase [Vicinamibacterales bacterium]|jgi:glyoxylase-like metal-dependent hydrolase (beta-lactamase superfamily II)|nr:MBL fold metallo-hydrolase [Vicinamibacterales bacterium]
MFEPLAIGARNPSAMTGDGNHTYLLASLGSAVLIDSGIGHPDHLREIDERLRAAGARLDRVLVTHAHGDHASGAPALAAAYPKASFAKYPWPDEDAKYAVPWAPLSDGMRIDAAGEPLTVLHTPGHSPDHVAFWHEPTRTAFTGDLVVLGSSVMIHTSRGGSLAQYLASLERVRALAPRLLLPAHGPAVTDPASTIAAYLEHRRLRERQVIDALARGLTDVPSIAGSIYDGLDERLLPAARENVRAHLEKLKAEGRAHEDAGRWRP